MHSSVARVVSATTTGDDGFGPGRSPTLLQAPFSRPNYYGLWHTLVNKAADKHTIITEGFNILSLWILSVKARLEALSILTKYSSTN